jgi:tetratricopeptide (TPR) repeat protein
MTSHNVLGHCARTMMLAAALFGAAASARAQDSTPAPVASPAEQRIAAVRKVIAAHPDQAQPYNDLALALSRRARETGDPAFYDRASEAITSALAIDPRNLDSKKMQVWILLGKHEFARAYDAAVALNKQVPDDVLVYGFVADASVELGKYKEAEDAVQWMLDMRPANLSGLTRAAYLRELFGDVDGAIDLFNASYSRMLPSEVEDRAWMLSQIGHLYLSIGQEREAEAALQMALQLYPRYHYALGYLAQVKLAQSKPEDAVALLRDLVAELPHAENVYALAEALERAGHAADAKRAFADFEQKALAESAAHDNANRELIAYYVEHAGKPGEALRIAEQEYAWRQDLFTRETYAWALAANHRYADAQKQMDEALAVGIRHADIFYRAGVIAAGQHDRDAAVRLLERSLQQAPRSSVAPAARKQLDRVKGADSAP